MNKFIYGVVPLYKYEIKNWQLSKIFAEKLKLRLKIRILIRSSFIYAL